MIINPFEDIDKDILSNISPENKAMIEKINILAKNSGSYPKEKKIREINLIADMQAQFALPICAIIPTDLIMFAHMPWQLTDACLEISYIYFEKIISILQKKPAECAGKNAELFEAFLRCIYYANVATPWARGSSEIINIFHLALRELIGFPLKNIYVLQTFDIIVLLSKNFNEFSEKYKTSLHITLNTHGIPMDWDCFEKAYQKYRYPNPYHHPLLTDTLASNISSSSSSVFPNNSEISKLVLFSLTEYRLGNGLTDTIPKISLLKIKPSSVQE